MKKRLMILCLAVALIITSLPGQNGLKNVKAEDEGAINDGVYVIQSVYNQKAITQTDVSNYYADCVVWNTDALSDLARFNVKKEGEYYTFTNTVTDKTMKITGKSNGDKLDFNGNDGTDIYKWKLVPITEGKYEGCYYIVSAVKNDNGEEECAEIISDDDKRDKDGAQVRLWTKAKSIDYEPRQIWKLKKTSVEYNGFTEEMNDTMVNAFKDYYYKYYEKTGYMTFHSSDDGFWGEAEIMEALLDGYETTGKAIYKDMFVTTYKDFIATNGEDWAWKDWNDDLAWAVLASVRAYILFGDEQYLTYGKHNYDLMYERANKRSDGMLIWKMNHENDDTTSCINGPATVGACYLAEATGDMSYYEKAKKLYSAWRNSSMYVREGEEIGHVWDTMHEYWCSTYNQGTFIGAATMLYEHFGDNSYYEDACNAVNHTMKALCYNNILIKEDAYITDNSKMRGILMRYLRKFIVDFNRPEYLSFFRDNAKIAWMNKNSKNLQWCVWNKKTSEDVTWECYTAYNAISLMANMPTYSDRLERDAYSLIEAEDMDYTKGLISENSDNTSGGRSLGGINSGDYTAYYNVDFGKTGCSKVKLRYSRKTEDAEKKGRIEIRLGSTNGTIIASVPLDNTGNWSDWREISVDTARVKGVQNLYVIFKSDTEHVCNLDYIQFEKATDNSQGYMFLYSESNNKYAQLKNGTKDTTILARSTSRGDWEQIGIVNNSDGTVSFKSLVTEKYIRAAYGSNGYYITANADTIDDESKFIVENLNEESDDTSVAIKSVKTGKYLLVDPEDEEMYILANADKVTGNQEKFRFLTADGSKILPKGAIHNIVTSPELKIEGYQISTILGGIRTIASVEPKINEGQVVKWGFIYGVSEVDGIKTNIKESDMVVNSSNKYIASFESTANGTAAQKFGESDTATYYVRTIKFGAFSTNEFTSKYMVRAYAVLDDGTYVYGDNISQYSIYDVAKNLYENVKMNTKEAHDYLFNKIVKVVNKDAKEIDYDWGNTIVTP